MRKSELVPSDFTEELLAKIVGIYFKERGWDLFPEVLLTWFNGRPDYIGVKDSLVMALECKKTLSYEVLDQLFKWRCIADNGKLSSDGSVKGIPNLLVAASFEAKTARLSELKAHLIKSNRFGYVAVRYRGLAFKNDSDVGLLITSNFDDQMAIELDGHKWDIREVITPKIQPGSRETSARIVGQLVPDMKRAVSGVSGKIGGNYSTPFRRTLMKAVAVLEQHKECHIQHIIEEINKLHGGHHYSCDSAAWQGITKFFREFGIAEAINGLPNYRLLPDYKDKVFSSETETQKRTKEQKAARLAAKHSAAEPHSWEKIFS